VLVLRDAYCVHGYKRASADHQQSVVINDHCCDWLYIVISGYDDRCSGG
jgi:hypothetical protein